MDLGHELDAGRQPRARVRLRVRRAARHADGPRPGADGARDRQHLGPPPARAHAARVRRGALRGPDRGRDRPPPRPPGARRRPSSSTTRSPPRSPRPPASPAATRPSARSRRSGSPSTASSSSSTRRSRSPGASRRSAAASPRSPSTRSRTAASSASSPRRPRLHLPARPARVRVRQHARGGARAPPLDRAHPGRDRGEPPIEVGSPPGRPQAQGGALDMPEHAPQYAPAPHRSTRAGSPARRAAWRRPAPIPRAAHRRLRADQPDPGPPRRRPRSCAVARCIWLIGILLGGIVAMQVSLLRLNSGIIARGADPEHAREAEHGAADARSRS